jgi:hypothetical protein
MAKKIVVFDFYFDFIDELGNFKDEVLIKYPGSFFLKVLISLLRDNNIDYLKLCDFVSMNNDDDVSYLAVSYESSLKRLRSLKDRNIVPFICLSLESIHNAKSFYSDIDSIVGQFQFSFLFSGVRHFLCAENQIKMHNIYWPYDSGLYLESVNWEEKLCLAFVASPKSDIAVNYSSFFSRLIRLPRHLYHSFVFNHSIFNHRSLYSFRFELIKYFGSKPFFYLRGTGWDKAFKYENILKGSKLFTPATAVDEKNAFLNKFKFTFCVENAIFPGYLTEKIFDAFYSGSVPVYLGDPNIDSVIPKNAFIDLRNFKSMNELEKYLINMDEVTWQEFRGRIVEFLKTEEACKYSSQYLSHELFKCIDIYGE